MIAYTDRIQEKIIYIRYDKRTVGFHSICFFLLLQHTAYVGGEGNEIFNDIEFICNLSGYH